MKTKILFICCFILLLCGCSKKKEVEEELLTDNDFGFSILLDDGLALDKGLQIKSINDYIGDEYEDILNDWERVFTEKPSVFTVEEKKEWLAGNTDVTIGSDAFFPFGDNIERAYKSGVKYVAQPGGSVRDDQVIETANKRGMAMCFTGMRLFHH